MNPVVVKDVIIGEGIPKICVPIVEKTKAGILLCAKNLASLEDRAFDIVEWRADWYEDIYEVEKVVTLIDEIQDILKVPVLFTCRSMNAGGGTRISAGNYRALINYVTANSSVDMVDVEVFTFPTFAKELIDNAHHNAVLVMATNYDFKSTPAQEEIVSRLTYMQKLGADLVRMAVTPKDKNDVLTLLAATEEMHLLHDDTPVITVSLGPVGVISRHCGEVFGSAIAFGTVGKTSVPGQMEARELRQMMEILHRSIGGDL